MLNIYKLYKCTKGHASVHVSLLCLIMLCIFKLTAHKANAGNETYAVSEMVDELMTIGLHSPW